MMTQYFRPLVQIGQAPKGAFPLAGGWGHFTQALALSRSGAREVIAARDLPHEWLEAFCRPRGAFCGVSLMRPRLMGILNATPDSFSDGGRHDEAEAAIAKGRALWAAGADIVDLGGESTRPGSQETPAEIEAARILPVLSVLAREGTVSVDTRKASVAQAAMAQGAQAINDVSGMGFDPAMAQVIGAGQSPVILMHMIGRPDTMQGLAEGAYADVRFDVFDALVACRDRARALGLDQDQIILDIGIGFGKTDAQTKALLSDIALFHGLGCGLLLGVSRKGFVGRMTGIDAPQARDGASAAIGLWALSQGVQMLRVHDIETHAQMIAAWQAASGAFGDGAEGTAG